MKNSALVIAVMIAFIAVFSNVPCATADPLTVIAVAGVATIILATTVDLAITDEDTQKDMRARSEDNENRVELRAAGSAEYLPIGTESVATP
jgi:ABC-type bacteriocin/lantibiotic exporter with double-glycine peptidase domain